MKHQKERFVLRTGSQKLDSQIGCHVGAVTVDLQLCPGNQKLRVLVNTLTRQHDPAVKTNRVRAQMPFSNHTGVIAASLQMLGNRVPRRIKPIEYRYTVEV